MVRADVRGELLQSEVISSKNEVVHGASIDVFWNFEYPAASRASPAHKIGSVQESHLPGGPHTAALYPELPEIWSGAHVQQF
jgi:hypothetical protein